MKRDYTILVPNMLPMHFEMIVQVLRNYGYRLDLLRSSGHKIADTGLKYCHNDACYPAWLSASLSTRCRAGNTTPTKPR